MWLDLEEEIAEEFGSLTKLDLEDLLPTSPGRTMSVRIAKSRRRRARGLCVDCPSASVRYRCDRCAAKNMAHQRLSKSRLYQPKPRVASPKSVLADRHRARNVVYMRAKALRPGTGTVVCVRCSRPCANGRKRCEVCLARDRARAQANPRQLRPECPGRCNRCSRQTDGAFKLCQVCREDRRARAAQCRKARAA